MMEKRLQTNGCLKHPFDEFFGRHSEDWAQGFGEVWGIFPPGYVEKNPLTKNLKQPLGRKKGMMKYSPFTFRQGFFS